MSLNASTPHARELAFYAAWNNRDAQGICELYADDVVFSSPFVTRMDMSEDGVLNGIEALFHYVKAALERVPNLHFEGIANCQGVAHNTLVYRNQSSHVVTETHEYDQDGLIRAASVAYSIAPLKRKNYGSR
ncbi:nuclear transport factor 2 family protein [Asticcacaulis sp. SL142]|jgi:ketosteroid isomerase-like protein|uniref:nuclear transport factor 2 family protein n=1 Tax=Asticcacaulis sp. SL142 TaxID=2995155 RepID=UPI00226CE054|nr:nuclear transport factor 2 family protein [Asticcacaulis sp. SL142]WAC48097.1 nuclear transport factor 2 family protein [Asticcacaulis sp. SL142]